MAQLLLLLWAQAPIMQRVLAWQQGWPVCEASPTLGKHQKFYQFSYARLYVSTESVRQWCIESP